jgi:hypothetical protein
MIRGGSLVQVFEWREESMGKIKVCRKCGVPRLVSKDQSWLDNGVIQQTRDKANRMVFYESDNLSSLFAGIEGIIGLPIEHIVIESKRLDVKEYTEKLLPSVVRKIVRRIGFGVVAMKLRNLGACYGYGAIELGDSQRNQGNEDYLSMLIRNPHSITFFTGEVLGAWEAVDGRESYATYGKTGEDSYKVTVHVGKHPLELSGRLSHRSYPFKPGTSRFERCSACGVPQDVSRYRWDLDEGTIRHPETQRRMMIISPAGIDAVLDDLEAELGEAIPEAVVEAQRRFVREAMKEQDWQRGEGDYRSMLALRGLGQLAGMEMDENHLTVTIENSCMPLIMVGTMQGIFELAGGIENSTYAWKTEEDGNLSITITAT